jgi:RNA methyltransferase, RsmD family
MRITGGRFRGRNLGFPKGAGIRPTPSRVRQALFNILGDIEGRTMLDLFSGSGLMALEALSRGAAAVLSIERSPRAIRHLREIRSRWHLEERWRIEAGGVRALLPRIYGRRFDVIFADPPYGRDVSVRIPAWLDAAAITCGSLVIEESSRSRPSWPPGWTVVREKRYGDTCLYFLCRTDAGES